MNIFIYIYIYKIRIYIYKQICEAIGYTIALPGVAIHHDTQSPRCGSLLGIPLRKGIMYFMVPYCGAGLLLKADINKLFRYGVSCNVASKLCTTGELLCK